MNEKEQQTKGLGNQLYGGLSHGLPPLRKPAQYRGAYQRPHSDYRVPPLRVGGGLPSIGEVLMAGEVLYDAELEEIRRIKAQGDVVLKRIERTRFWQKFALGFHWAVIAAQLAVMVWTWRRR